jgi:NTP pyrophosphatase (non-canonical NTP hydrolase)
MKKELLDFIKVLSEADKKTLLQKALKTAEEVGELAKAVLPYENSPSTNHRFSDKENILEEVADVILCALSVAYNLGLDSEQIETMIGQKAEFWSSLQARERKHPFPLPFEIHVTVKNANKENFILSCQKLNVKPILLDLQNQDGIVVLNEVMTSSKFYGNNQAVYEELCRISKGLKDEGFDIVREKIESVPFHPSAPSKENGVKSMPKNGYFESHIGIIVSDDRKSEISELAKKFNAHISKNTRKKLDNGKEKLMLTFRLYQGFYEDFKLQSSLIHQEMAKLGFEPEREIVEFSIYDTKVSHDKEWIKVK